MPEIEWTQFSMFVAMLVGFAFIWKTVKGSGDKGSHANPNKPAIQEIKSIVDTTAHSVDSLTSSLEHHRAEVLEELGRQRDVMAKLFDKDEATNLRVSDVDSRVARMEGRWSAKGG